MNFNIWTFDNFLTEKECNNFISQINNKKKHNNFTNTGLFINDKYINLELATYFFNKIKKLINIEILRPNNIIMTGKYLPNQSFSLHTDTGLFYDRIKKEKSKYTLLIYLNDDYENGETEFYDNNFNKQVVIKPKKGKALLFDIDLWHSGNQVLKKEKYWIGCEIIGKFNTRKN
jgi:hypothetical protein